MANLHATLKRKKMVNAAKYEYKVQNRMQRNRIE